MTYSTIAVIYNPNSTGPGEALAKEFEAELNERLPRQKVELIKTKHAGHGEELAYSIAKKSKNPLIISSSGDGGYNEVVNGAMKAQLEGFNPTTGLLPAGNANDHYVNLHTKSIIDQIVKNQTKKIDLLKLKSVADGKPIERYAHSYIGFGLTPQIGNELNKKKLNPINEVWIVAKSLFTIKPVQLVINKRARWYESIIFSNVDVMSKYLKISKPSSMTDGKFEVTIFKRRSKLTLILLLLRTSTVGAKEDKKASTFSLKTIRKTHVQTDGEIILLNKKADVLITCEKQILNCVI